MLTTATLIVLRIGMDQQIHRRAAALARPAEGDRGPSPRRRSLRWLRTKATSSKDVTLALGSCRMLGASRTNELRRIYSCRRREKRAEAAAFQFVAALGHQLRQLAVRGHWVVLALTVPCMGSVARASGTDNQEMAPARGLVHLSKWGYQQIT